MFLYFLYLYLHRVVDHWRCFVAKWRWVPGFVFVFVFFVVVIFACDLYFLFLYLHRVVVVVTIGVSGVWRSGALVALSKFPGESS